MSIFSPEEKEGIESGWERKKFNESLDKSIVSRFNAGFDNFPDPVVCPVRSCKNPLKIEIRSNTLRLFCANCGFERIIRKRKK